MEYWKPSSWREKPATQLPKYECINELNEVVSQLSCFQPLVHVNEIDKLRRVLHRVVNKEAFILHIGDCAESFLDANDVITTKKIEHIQTLKMILSTKINIPVITIGRLAGQYAKPRTYEYEINHDNSILMSYRGDIINQFPADLNSRRPNPNLMLKAYACSQTIIKQLNQYKVHDDADRIYISHEALLLFYEEALTKVHENKWYNLSTHLLWLGIRTLEHSPAHVEYLRGIENPIAIKVGPSTCLDNLVSIIKKLNKDNLPGRLSIIHRFGSSYIDTYLPALINKINQHQLHVLWLCDPMHGNTELTNSGMKTRKKEKIISELEQAFAIHAKMKTYLAGVHLEATYDEVIECVDKNHNECALSKNYKSLLDPRLNYNQSIEIINAIGDYGHTARILD